ncbi:MetQ/NlpA family ABC transporter substrate-binding protein [Robertmurraya sp. DFI.2.37]|jgi:D-methionine transport system substrate-binding protein|uniref:MetQ/NlpA family ABC transporter substrate-binding protein n=1 Tax=Robertmurraya sp. DFI.2.37 TaxID=3031819 RepID=UPI00124501AC|nr:MetQ/NlpA family ABC transporter substrate-binding protein [Robertmurraya sp. DFI.2.37]MDF1509140.1 MetQ/NlpA family ABC transporter substrate-binding protein [Robertmurraya sp. DFI.2.37]
MKKWVKLAFVLFVLGFLAACGSNDSNSAAEGEETKEIQIGATAGPYSDMLKKAIIPGLEEKGYKVKVIEFSDYIQPNNALDNGDIQANLFQHTIYLENFAKENNMDLTALITVPTAPMGIYSNEFTSIEEISDGASITIPNDPTNAARAFNTLQDEGLIVLDENADPLTVSEKDIIENKKNLKFEPIEAGQLPRSVESADLAAVPGNFALAAGMDLLSALALENMLDSYRNVVAVKAENKDDQLAKDIVEIVQSDSFEKVIDDEFQGFGKPEWMNE